MHQYLIWPSFNLVYRIYTLPDLPAMPKAGLLPLFMVGPAWDYDYGGSSSSPWGMGLAMNNSNRAPANYGDVLNLLTKAPLVAGVDARAGLIESALGDYATGSGAYYVMLIYDIRTYY